MFRGLTGALNQWISSVASWRLSRSRRLQFDIDTLQLFLLFRFLETGRPFATESTTFGATTAADSLSADHQIAKALPPVKAQQEYVAAVARSQCEEMLRHIAAAYRQAGEESAMAGDLLPLSSSSLLRTIGFIPRVFGPSPHGPHHGNKGVRVDLAIKGDNPEADARERKSGLVPRSRLRSGSVPRIAPGTLVCLYPGLIYDRADLRRVPFGRSMEADLHIISRPDGAIIDGFISGDSNWAEETQRARQQLLTGLAATATPAGSLDDYPLAAFAEHAFAVGHLVNHGRPNVMKVAIDFDLRRLSTDDVRQLSPFIPNRRKSFRPSLLYESILGGSTTGAAPDRGSARLDDAAVVVKMIGLVATRFIDHGEELFMNYRLNPRLARPQWYMPVDEQEEQRRWAKR